LAFDVPVPESRRFLRNGPIFRIAVERFERGDSVRSGTIKTNQRALENAGVIFIDANGVGPGARLTFRP
jgi:hypothetical protein